MGAGPISYAIESLAEQRGAATCFIAFSSSMSVQGSEFSAVNPQLPPLLAVNLVPGLQYSPSRPGATIASTGSLSVGQDLTLVSDRLELQGQLQAGRDLTLHASDTVKIRDTVDRAFRTTAGSGLLIQADRLDIFALNHPDSGLVAGGAGVLRSA
jgi:hypothetical protein